MHLVILDRDGVINQDLPSSVRSVDQMKLLPGAGEAIALLNSHCIPVVVATNQAVVGRGDLSSEGLKAIHDYMEKELAEKFKARLDKIYVSTEVEPCLRRKPGPGLLLEACTEFKVVPQKAVMIGDDRRDLDAAFEAECLPLLVRTGKGARQTLPFYMTSQQVFPGIYEAVVAIVEGRLHG